MKWRHLGLMLALAAGGVLAGGAGSPSPLSPASFAGGGGSGPAVTPVTTISASGTAQALAFPASGNAAFDITKTGNCAITLSGGTVGQLQTLTIQVRPGAGGFTESFTNTIRWPGSVAPTPSTSGINVYYVSTLDGGATLIGNY